MISSYTSSEIYGPVKSNGTKQYVLKKKMNKLKRPLTRLNGMHFSHISSRAKRAADELELEQNIVLSGGNSTKDIKGLRTKAAFLMEAERLFFAQKVKNHFVQLGDRCSKFFHGLIKRNNKRNSILALTKNDGMVTSNGEEIASEFVNYYLNLLGTTTPRNKLNTERLHMGKVVDTDQKQALSAHISPAEGKAALDDIEDDKSPGPDGFGCLFFKKAWGVVGQEVIDAVEEFFETGMLLKQWNHAFIALVPKSTHSNMVSDYSPISCCTVFYKII